MMAATAGREAMLALYHNDMSLCAQKVRVCLAEKALEWESRHLVLRAGEHQQPWYLELNRRAVVQTLIDGDRVIPESNVILEYLDEAYPDPPLAPKDAYGRAKMRLWTKQLDEDIHDASAAILSFGIAFRHQYLERGELGKKMLEQIPNVFKRERRRDVVELPRRHRQMGECRLPSPDAAPRRRMLAADSRDRAGALTGRTVKGTTKGACMPASRAAPAALVLGAAMILAPGAAAQSYPAQNITFQVAFAAGGIADVVARLVGQRLTDRLGHTVVVENRGGAGGNIAAKMVSGTAPDGYTVLATTTSLAVNETATRNKGFSVDDLRTIAIVAFSPDVLAVHPSNPAKDLKELIDNGKEKSFTYGSAGVGTGPHIGAEYFFREVAKVKAVHVPFTGGAPAVQSAIGNHIDAIVLTLPTVVPPITQGLLRGLGLASASRNSAVPNVPTYGETGFPDVYSGSWVGFFAPAKTPEAVIAKLNAEINEIMKEPEAQQKIKAIGFDPIIKTQVEAADYFKSEVAIWGKMTSAIGFSSN